MIVNFLVVYKWLNFLLSDSMTVSSKSKKIEVMKKIVEEETVIICKRQKKIISPN
jgi:hypothetical protein